VWVDADDGEEHGEPRGPYDGVKGRGQEVVFRDAVKPGKVQGVVDVHKHGNKPHKETVDNKTVRSERAAYDDIGKRLQEEGEKGPGIVPPVVLPTEPETEESHAYSHEATDRFRN
jgi:hypothetical protein